MAATCTLNVANKPTIPHCTRPRVRPTVNARRRPSAFLALTQALPKSWAPRPLPIATVPKVNMKNVIEVAPQYSGLSLEHVLKSITSEEIQSRYIQGLIREDARRMSKDVSAAPSDEGEFEATHLFSVTDGQGSQPLHFPCHGIVMASQFASLGSIAAPLPRIEGMQHLVDVTVPFPTAFGILRDYAYTHSIDGLMSSLLPLEKSRLPNSGRSATVDVTARAFATSLSSEQIIARAVAVHTVYTNAVHLGFNDAQFWKCIHIAWAIITRALQLWRQSEKI